MSERDGSEIERLWILMTPYSSFYVGSASLRYLFQFVGSELPLIIFFYKIKTIIFNKYNLFYQTRNCVYLENERFNWIQKVATEMFVTKKWWQLSDIGDRISMTILNVVCCQRQLGTRIGQQHPKIVTIIFVSPTSVTNIDVAWKAGWFMYWQSCNCVFMICILDGLILNQ